MEKPLFSIYCITYNSSKTVLEALESAKSQTYDNIELIISDDCSKDNTVEICRDWLNKNGDRFTRTELLTTPSNTGVAQNCQRAITAAKGIWLKGLAGDDALLSDAIEKFWIYIRNHPEEKLVLARTAKYNTILDEGHFIGYGGSKNHPINMVSTAWQQFQILLNGACIDAPGVIYHRSVFEIPELKNCGYAGLEDYPFFLTYTRLGYRIPFCDEVVVKYRQSPTSLQRTSNYGNLITKSYLAFFFDETHRYYHGIERIALYVTNIFNYVECYTHNRILRNLWHYSMYPIYYAFYQIVQAKKRKRLKKVLEMENKI